jgi:hypothetical protein
MVASATPPLPYPGGADPTGYIHADPHWTPQLQQQYEQAINSGNQAAAQQINDAAWQDYDRRRASASTAEKGYMDAYHSNAAAGSASGTPATPESTTAGIERNPKTGKWDWLDPKTKQWSEAASFDDIWSRLTPDEQALHPRFWYDNLANNQDAIEYNDRMNRYRQPERNPKTGKWDWLDPKTKQWSEAASFDDIWSRLTPDEQALHPRFWYDNLANNQDAIEYNDRMNRYRQAQTSALSGTPTLRSTPVRF